MPDNEPSGLNNHPNSANEAPIDSCETAIRRLRDRHQALGDVCFYIPARTYWAWRSPCSARSLFLRRPVSCFVRSVESFPPHTLSYIHAHCPDHRQAHTPIHVIQRRRSSDPRYRWVPFSRRSSALLTSAGGGTGILFVRGTCPCQRRFRSVLEGGRPKASTWR